MTCKIYRFRMISMFVFDMYAKYKKIRKMTSKMTKQQTKNQNKLYNKKINISTIAICNMRNSWHLIDWMYDFDVELKSIAKTSNLNVSIWNWFVYHWNSKQIWRANEKVDLICMTWSQLNRLFFWFFQKFKCLFFQF